MKDCVFFTIVDDHHYLPIGTEKMINSFKYFHPEIDLVIFRQKTIDRIFKEKNINFFMAKPTFAKLLASDYRLVVNIDADHVFLARCDEILKGDYDIGAPLNLNDYENTAVENVTKEMFLQGGMIASTKQEFWDRWEEANKDAMKYKCRENDIMNLVIYNDFKHLKLKIFDKDKDYYGCKSLNREKEFYMYKDRVLCRGEQVFLYHHSKGGRLPKLVFEKMGFPQVVINFMNKVSSSKYSQNVKVI